jgi:hypothetical protein
MNCEINKMKSTGGLFGILTKIEARPGMYIGRRSVLDLFMFLVGYKTARRELGLELTKEEVIFYEKFHGFVEDRYQIHSSNSWARIIMFYVQDEHQGFQRFFELLEEFQSQDWNAKESSEDLVQV